MMDETQLADKSKRNLPVDNASFFVKVADAMSNLHDNMSGEILAEICELDNLMEKLATLHHFNRCDKVNSSGTGKK